MVKWDLDWFWGVKGLGAERIAVLHLLDGSYQETEACRYDSGREKVTGGRNLRSLK